MGTYPPRRCGIATFTRDLREGLGSGSVIALDRPEDGLVYPPEVVMRLSADVCSEYRRAAELLNGHADVVTLQHEYGIFGGPDGAMLLELLASIQVPVVTTLHTVRANPDPRQREVLRAVVRASARVVVMSERAKLLTAETLDTPAGCIDVIPHGVPSLPFGQTGAAKERLGVQGRLLILTFGLLGPNKRVELVLEALPPLVAEFPNLVYVVLGATHPELRRRQGEVYRESLRKRTHELGLDRHVCMVDRYVSSDELAIWLQAADVFVTPYGSVEQVASGTLAYAAAAGKAIISTPYEHALDLLSEDRGLLVPFDDVAALTTQLHRLLSSDTLRIALGRRAYELGHKMTWNAVARDYRDVFRQVSPGRVQSRSVFECNSQSGGAKRTPPPVRRHLERLSDGYGLFQHATGIRPDVRHGYCTDDVARALIVDLLQGETLGHAAVEAAIWDRFAFLTEAFDGSSGRFRNFRAANGTWLEAVGSEDSHGRALHALGEAALRGSDRRLQRLARRLFERALPAAVHLSHLRPWAYSILGCDALLARSFDDRAGRSIELLGGRLAEAFNRVGDTDWPWPEEVVTYDNGVLPRALIIAGVRTQRPNWVSLGQSVLRWLVRSQTAVDGHLSLVGNRGWWRRGSAPAPFDQQPIEAASLLDAAESAYLATQDLEWVNVIEAAFAWFLGTNDHNVALADPLDGSCADGLTPSGRNGNFGAESTLAWLAAVEKIRRVRQSVVVAEAPALRPGTLSQIVEHVPEVRRGEADGGVRRAVVQPELP